AAGVFTGDETGLRNARCADARARVERQSRDGRTRLSAGLLRGSARLQRRAARGDEAPGACAIGTARKAHLSFGALHSRTEKGVRGISQRAGRGTGLGPEPAAT